MSHQCRGALSGRCRRFLPDLSTKLHPITGLLEREREGEWVWSDVQEQAFGKVKAMLVSAPALAYYSANQKTVISADASNYGLRPTSLKELDCELKLVALCSCVLSDSERRYSQKTILGRCVGMQTFCTLCAKHEQFPSANGPKIIGVSYKRIQLAQSP